MSDKPNCYDCKHRGSVPGDCHSCCTHPESGHDGDLIMGLANLLSGGQKNNLNIRGNPHGVQNGWFLWPANFDPTWLENCDGFEQKD